MYPKHTVGEKEPVPEIVYNHQILNDLSTIFNVDNFFISGKYLPICIVKIILDSQIFQ